MNYIICDILDNLKSMELSQKGHNIFATVALIVSGLYWLLYSGNGEFFQISGCVLYIASAAWFASKTSFAKRFLNAIFEDE